jgi:hypothetical protein
MRQAATPQPSIGSYISDYLTIPFVGNMRHSSGGQMRGHFLEVHSLIVIAITNPYSYFKLSD